MTYYFCTLTFVTTAFGIAKNIFFAPHTGAIHRINTGLAIGLSIDLN